MVDNISIANLLTISERAGMLRSSKSPVSSQEIAQDILKPLFGTLGWEFDSVIDTTSTWGKPFVNYDGRWDIYSGSVGGQTQVIAAGQSDPSSPLNLAKLIQYAYNKNSPWALSVTPERLSLFHTHENAIKGETRISSYWEMGLEFLPSHFKEVSHYLSATSASEGVLCNIDKEVRASNKKTALPVNRKLFESLRQWRGEMVDKLFKLGFQNFNLEAIDQHVNHLLNQIVFIRVAEDRQFGETTGLLELVNKWSEIQFSSGNLLSQLKTLLEDYANRYKVELFVGFTLLEIIAVEPLIAQLIRALHSPGFPTVKYDFSVIDVDVLGSMYEQYLRLRPQTAKNDKVKQGRLIGDSYDTVLTPSDKAVGVHYTPSYIVQYIVGSSMKRWEHQTNQSGRPRVLDMACGSGSFLLASYRILLNKAQKASQRQLSQIEKQQLLKECIWGVDKDPKAVEICKLNLWLHALEAKQSLPNLDDNIKVGDSLLDPDLAPIPRNERSQSTPDATDPIVWRRDFQKVMTKGGWDIIVGNPPYVRVQKIAGPEKSQYIERFSQLQGNYDLSLAFVAMALKIVNSAGIIGFIISNSFLKANYADILRKIIIKESRLLGILDFSDQRVFEGVGAYTCILFLGNGKENHPRMGVLLQLTTCPAAQLTKWETENSYDEYLVSGNITLSSLAEGPWVLVPDREQTLRKKLKDNSTSLEQIARIFQGFKTGKDELFILEATGRGDNADLVNAITSTRNTVSLETKVCYPLVKGGDINRFHIRRNRRWALFPYRDGKLLTEDQLADEAPLAWAYLNSVKEPLKNRPEVQRGNVEWYEYSFAKNMKLYNKPKLLTPDIAPQSSFAFDEHGTFAFSGGVAGGYGIIIHTTNLLPHYLLGLLNSQLIDWYIQAGSAHFRGGYFSYENRFIKDVPIVIPDIHSQQLVDQVTKIAKLLIDNYEQSASDRIKGEREYRDIAMIIAKLNEELNDTVMNLYDLTLEEKNLIQQSPYWKKVNLLRGS